MLVHKASRIISITPTISTTIYAPADQVGDVKLVSEAMLSDGGCAILQSITVIDKSKQNADLTLFIFDDVPTVTSSDNGALNISDSEMALKCIGAVDILSEDYTGLSASSVATVTKIGLLLKSNAGKNSVALPSGASKKDLWILLQTAGTPTYGSTSDLTIKLGLEQHG